MMVSPYQNNIVYINNFTGQDTKKNIDRGKGKKREEKIKPCTVNTTYIYKKKKKNCNLYLQIQHNIPKLSTLAI